MPTPLAFRIMIPFIVSLAMFMEAIDSTVINTAIPVMSLSLHVNPIDLKIALISYLLSLAMFIPISGWIADKFGIKRVFIFALFIFTTSSFFCGLANTLPQLVIARIVQGIGGSLMLPVGRLIIVRTYQKHELVNKMSQVVIVGALGMMLGPTLGGTITQYLSWRWIFYINIPVGLLNIAIAYQWLVNDKPKPVHKLDFVGLLLFAGGLALLTFGLSALSESTISKHAVAAMIATSILLFFIYIRHSKKYPHPVVNTQLFGYRTFLVSVLGNLFSRLSFGGLPFLLPLLLQLGFGFSPQLSGFLLAPTAIGVLVAKPVSIKILRWLGFKKLLIINTTMIGITLCAFSLLDVHTSLATISLFTFIFGCLSALQYTGMNSLAYSEITQELYSSATSIMGTLQQVSQSFGVAISAILIQFYSSGFLKPATITISALHHAFVTMGLLTFISILFFTRLRSDDGMEMIGAGMH